MQFKLNYKYYIAIDKHNKHNKQPRPKLPKTQMKSVIRKNCVNFCAVVYETENKKKATRNKTSNKNRVYFYSDAWKKVLLCVYVSLMESSSTSNFWDSFLHYSVVFKY